MARGQGTDDRGCVAMLKITREQRDVLWENAAHEIDGGGEDLVNTPGRGNLHDYLRIRRRFAVAMWTLDDLGWLRDDPRDRFYLTLPAADIAWMLGELDEYALENLRFASDALADPVKEFRDALEHGGANLEDCIADARRDCDEHLERHSVCCDLLAQVSS